MRDPTVPVDESVAVLAQRVLVGAVLLPTMLGLVLGVVAKLVGAIAGIRDGVPLPGLLTWIIMIVVIQLIIVAIGRTHYFSGVALESEGPAELAGTEPGIFHHEAH